MRKRAKRAQHFGPDFRTDHMQRHLQQQRPERWKEHRSLGDAERKKKHFKSAPVRSNGRRENPEDDAELMLLINKGIVGAIIGEMLSGEEGAPPVLELQGVEGDGDGKIENCGRRKAKVKKEKEHRLAIDYVSHGSSFRLAARILDAAKRRIGVSDLGLCSEGKVSELLRIMRAVIFRN